MNSTFNAVMQWNNYVLTILPTLNPSAIIAIEVKKKAAPLPPIYTSLANRPKVANSIDATKQQKNLKVDKQSLAALNQWENHVANIVDSPLFPITKNPITVLGIPQEVELQQSINVAATAIATQVCESALVPKSMLARLDKIFVETEKVTIIKNWLSRTKNISSRSSSHYPIKEIKQPAGIVQQAIILPINPLLMGIEAQNDYIKPPLTIPINMPVQEMTSVLDIKMKESCHIVAVPIHNKDIQKPNTVANFSPTPTMLNVAVSNRVLNNNTEKLPIKAFQSKINTDKQYLLPTESPKTSNGIEDYFYNTPKEPEDSGNEIPNKANNNKSSGLRYPQNVSNDCSRIINVNKPLIENFTINVKDTQEGLLGFRQQVEEVMLGVLKG